MELYQLIIAYDGTEFSGFQRQKDHLTIQGELEKALRKIGWNGQTIFAAGRTDAGVHATGQVVTFQHTWQHSLQELQAAVNHYLPDSISVREVSLREESFHPRYDAISREYSYAILVADSRDPQKERFMWRVDREMDWEAVFRSAELFCGEHDFRFFGRPMKPGDSTIRKVIRSDWLEHENGEYSYHIAANAFLYHMVRRIVFVMMEVGCGQVKYKELQQAIAAEGDGGKIHPGIAPAHGLTLEQVQYNDNKKD